MAADCTRELILDAAERLFAEHGYASVSVRSLAREAGVSLAAMNYHFGSKAQLFGAVVERSFAPLDLHRLRRLDELEAEAQPGAVAIEHLVRALVEPALERAADRTDGATWLRLIGGIRAEPSAPWRDAIEAVKSHTLMIDRFVEAFERAVPHLGAEEVRVRFFFMIGVISNSLVDRQSMAFLGGGIHDLEAEPAQLVDPLVQFVSAGFGAPSDRRRPGRRSRQLGGKRP